MMKTENKEFTFPDDVRDYIVVEDTPWQRVVLGIVGWQTLGVYDWTPLGGPLYIYVQSGVL